MEGSDMQTEKLTEKMRHELIEYAFNVVYLTLVFAAFTQYRRFLLAEYSITYTNYWVGADRSLGSRQGHHDRQRLSSRAMAR